MNKYSTSEITKRNYDVYIKTTETSATSFNLATSAADFNGAAFVRIGALTEQPKFSTEKGEEIAIATGSKINLSQVASFECSVIEATDANYTAMKNQLINKQSDVIFTDVSTADVAADEITIAGGIVTACGVVGKQVIMLRGLALFPALSVTGNDRNLINITGSKETGKTLTASDIIIVEGA